VANLPNWYPHMHEVSVSPQKIKKQALNRLNGSALGMKTLRWRKRIVANKSLRLERAQVISRNRRHSNKNFASAFTRSAMRGLARYGNARGIFLDLRLYMQHRAASSI